MRDRGDDAETLVALPLDGPPAPLTDPVAVEAVATAIRRAGRFALDLEFMSEERYIPVLALAQVAWTEGEGIRAVAIDPLAVDLRPIAALVADPGVETVLHSAQADLALLGVTHGVAGASILDTQIAAAFLGMGEQIGYAPFIQRVLGEPIDKGGQFTEWLRRPLAPEQLQYALADVLHLLPAWDLVHAELVERGRASWVLEECARLAQTWAERVPPEEMYRRISGWSSLRQRQLGALRGVAAWREREAISSNRPPSRLVPDRTMLELARRPPQTMEALRDVRGLTDGTARRYGAAILDALKQGIEDPPEVEVSPGPLSPQAQAWAGVLGGLVQAHCREAEIASRFVASRADVEVVARWWFEGDHDEVPPVPVMHGWRRELAGDSLLRWLGGELALLADAREPLGFRLVPTPDL